MYHTYSTQSLCLTTDLHIKRRLTSVSKAFPHSIPLMTCYATTIILFLLYPPFSTFSINYFFFFFFFNDTAPPEIYPLPLHDALPISIVNEESPPPPEEVAHAKRVIEGNAKAAAEGRASFAIDGKMIDVPVVARAERLLARHAAIQAREATMPRPAA